MKWMPSISSELSKWQAQEGKGEGFGRGEVKAWEDDKYRR